LFPVEGRAQTACGADRSGRTLVLSASRRLPVEVVSIDHERELFSTTPVEGALLPLALFPTEDVRRESTSPFFGRPAASLRRASELATADMPRLGSARQTGPSQHVGNTHGEPRTQQPDNGLLSEAVARRPEQRIPSDTDGGTTECQRGFGQ